MIDVPLTKKQAELRILIDRMTRRYGSTKQGRSEVWVF